MNNIKLQRAINNNYKTEEKICTLGRIILIRLTKINQPGDVTSHQVGVGVGGWVTWGTVWWLVRNHLRKGEDSYGDGVATAVTSRLGEMTRWASCDHGPGANVAHQREGEGITVQ